MPDSLWGEEFKIQETTQVAKKIINKINKPKKQVNVVAEKAVKSKKVSIEDKLKIIEENVYRILGVYKENTQVIKTKEELHSYINKAIENGVIAIDTETNNSLQPITCKLMGPCIYTEGMKNAYVPINHVNRITGERLSWQLTENDIKEEFSRLSNTKIIMHNGKFDYSVIKCTCNLELDIYWDTLIGARILNENEKAGLKEQYISKIDPSIEKYSIEHLFSGIEYALVDPDLFALYAATDSFMTYKLYQYQVQEFNKEENKELLSAFFENEIPLIKVVAEMEMTGISIDLDYAQELSVEYNKQLNEVDSQIDMELHKYDEQISKWRKTPEANYHPPKCSGMGEGKSKSEQLGSPISVSSTLQLAILLYDVLKLPSVDKKSPRGTGEEILEKLYETHKDLTILKLILKRRSVAKLVTTYIDKLPKCIEPSTGKIHCKYNQYGADTGRMSSSDPNLQNIPSSNHEIRKMFVASTEERDIELTANFFKVSKYDEVQLEDGSWVSTSDIKSNMILSSGDEVKDIEVVDNYYYLYIL